MISEDRSAQDKPKEKKKRLPRSLPALAAASGANDMADVVYSCKVDTTPSNWESLPIYSTFSRSADGSFPLIKISKTQYADLRTQRSQWCGSGRCYRVIM